MIYMEKRIQLKTLNLVKFDEEYQAHKDFINQLGTDQELVSNLELEELNDQNFTKMDLMQPYYFIVEDQLQSAKVGILIMDFFKQGTAVELRYAVKKEFRGKGYATKILHEVGSYLFENLDHLVYIELYIDANNKYSIQAAKNAQFKPEGSSVYARFKH